MKPRRPVAALLSFVLAGALLTGCTAARNDLDTGVSLCFRVLPAARLAAGDSSSFAGVRSLPVPVLVKAVTEETHPGGAPVPPPLLKAALHQSTCLVAFRGNFVVAAVSRGWAPAPGPYLNAVVVVRLSDEVVLATVLFKRIPQAIRFFHGTAFVR